MPFKKKHKLGFLSVEDMPLDKDPLTIKLRQGVKDKLKTIPDWNPKLKNLIEQWVSSELNRDEPL